MSPPFRLCRRLPFVSAVASLSSLPSPPFRLCRRLPLLLRRRRKGAAGYIPPEDASPRRYHSNQPFRYNQSAITLQTTTATPTFTTTSLLLSRCRRLPQPLPLPQPVCSYRAADNHYTIGIPQGYRGRTADAPQTQ